MNYGGVRQSNLGFLQKPPTNQTRKAIQRSYNFTDQIFLKSINTSHIGYISGNNKPIQQIDFEELLPSVEELQQQEQKQKKKKRINFSTYRGIPSDHNLKYTDSRIISPRQEKSQINIKIEDQIVELEDDCLAIVSFQGKGGKDLVNQNGCMFCSNNNIKSCKLVLENESTMEIFIPEGESKQYKKLFASVNFDTIDVHIQYKNKQIAIIVGDYRLLLRHNIAEVAQNWFDQLWAMKKQSKGSQFKLRQLLQINEFYQRRYQTQNFFTQNCQTGDILLFQDTHFFAKAQRFFTRSDFDHVAVAIKDMHYGLLMFESMSSGVSLTPWRSVIRHGWFQNIPRITWRRLNANRDDKFFSTVQKFVKENLEKSYHISFAKLTANVSMVHAPPTVDANGKKSENAEQGFFCSQLVATLYKELGLLTRDTNNPNYQPSSKFFPKDFSVRSQRKLDVGSLSPQYDIFFDRRLLKLNYKNIKLE